MKRSFEMVHFFRWHVLFLGCNIFEPLELFDVEIQPTWSVQFQKTPWRLDIYNYIYIYTWNLFVLYFGAWTLQKNAFLNQNNGHLGSRYIYLGEVDVIWLSPTSKLVKYNHCVEEFPNHPWKFRDGTQRKKVWKMIFLFYWVIFWFHVRFSGGLSHPNPTSPKFTFPISYCKNLDDMSGSDWKEIKIRCIISYFPRPQGHWTSTCTYQNQNLPTVDEQKSY